MELHCALDMPRQQYRGFRLDMSKAINRWHELHEEIKSTEEAFRPHMPPRLKMKAAKLADFAKWLKDSEKMYAWLPEEDAAEMQDGLEAVDFDDITHNSDAATQRNPTNKGGDYSKTAQKYIKEARGNVHDYPTH